MDCLSDSLYAGVTDFQKQYGFWPNLYCYHLAIRVYK